MSKYLILVFFSFNCHANNEQEAYKKVGQIVYAKLNLQKVIRTVEKKYIPADVKEVGTWLLFARHLAVEKQITYKWTW